MQITVSGKQVELSDALRERVSSELASITGKYFEHAQDARITFGRFCIVPHRRDNLEVQISMLRAAFGAVRALTDPTVPRRGYQFTGEVRNAVSADNDVDGSAASRV